MCGREDVLLFYISWFVSLSTYFSNKQQQMLRIDIKREEDGAAGNGGAGTGEGEGTWEPPNKRRCPSEEDEAPKKQALRAHLALQLTHHSTKVRQDLLTSYYMKKLDKSTKIAFLLGLLFLCLNSDSKH